MMVIPRDYNIPQIKLKTGIKVITDQFNCYKEVLRVSKRKETEFDFSGNIKRTSVDTKVTSG